MTATAHPAGLNEDFDIATSEELAVDEIARLFWEACGNDPEELELEQPAVHAAVGREGRAAARLACAPWGARRDRGVARRALITGITGQDGSYLAELLLEKGYEVHGIVRRSSTEKFDRIEHLRDRITLHQGDLLDQRSLVDALRAARPDEVYNLAAMSFVAVSWTQPTLTAEFTAVGVTRLLEAMRDVVPGGALLPGLVERDVRQGPRDRRRPRRRRSTRARRTASPRPTATTSRSTTASRTACTRAAGSSSTTSRQRRGLEFVTRKITWHAAAIKLGLADELRLGNLDARRDWGYAKDYVEAMWLMLQQDRADDYVIATGVTHTVRECAELAFERVGLRAETTSSSTRRSSGRPRSSRWWATRQGASASSAGSRGRASSELIALMVDADLALLSASAPAARRP